MFDIYRIFVVLGGFFVVVVVFVCFVSLFLFLEDVEVLLLS